MSIGLLDLAPALLAFGLALVLTPAVRGLARRWGVVARPRRDRWHRQPTALLGGVAIFLAVVAALLAFGPSLPPGTAILAAGTVAFTTGLVDDLRRLRPYQKLAGQLLAAAVLLLDSVTFCGTGWPPLDYAITLFWLVGITNALNLLDNMDGLAAGVATVAAGFLAIDFWLGGQPGAPGWLAALAGALLGFLVYNSHPASIFMGDGGALFIGFFLAALALVGKPAGDSTGSLWAAVPVLILAVPIFDTTLVTVCRKRAGRAASQGGRDHTSHRLVALGLSERQAVWLLYGLAALAGFLALGVRAAAVEVGLMLTAGFAVLLTLFGLFLGRVDVYGETKRP